MRVGSWLLSAIIRLGKKGIKLTNVLAYYDTKLIIAVKSFIVQAPGLQGCNPGACTIKLFTSVIYRFL